MVDIPPYRWDYTTTFYGDGGVSTQSQYQSLHDIPDEHLEFLSSLKLFHRQEWDGQNYFFVHSGIRPGIALENQTAEDMLWLRDWEHEFLRRQTALRVTSSCAVTPLRPMSREYTASSSTLTLVSTSIPKVIRARVCSPAVMFAQRGNGSK